MENKYLLSIIKNTTLNIGEIGCANGYLKRFLDLNKCYNPYKGFDISEQAIKNAKKFYGENYFHLINENDKLKIINKKKFDIIYSRDTVPHQKDPYKFLEELISITSKFLILRLRTRNFGKTQLDYNLSCQLQPGDIWAPYIILNYSEFLNYLKSKKNIKSLISYCILSLKFLSNAPSGSSINTTCGSKTNDLATATRCCCPPDNCIGILASKP